MDEMSGEVTSPDPVIFFQICESIRRELGTARLGAEAQVAPRDKCSRAEGANLKL